MFDAARIPDKATSNGPTVDHFLWLEASSRLDVPYLSIFGLGGHLVSIGSFVSLDIQAFLSRDVIGLRDRWVFRFVRPRDNKLLATEHVITAIGIINL